MRTLVVAHLSATLVLAPSARADEGMWLFNNFPEAAAQGEVRSTSPTQWLEHVRKSSVRFNSGGSGSFVSADGLVMTNHHVGADCLHKLSTQRQGPRQGRLLRQDARRGDQVRRPRAQRPRSTSSDVTKDVKSAVKPGMDDAAVNKAQKAMMSAIEKESPKDRTAQRRGHALPGRPVPPLPVQEVHRRAPGLRARERTSPSSAAIPTTSSTRATTSTSAFFRVYENDKPVKPEHYLKWSRRRARRRAGLRVGPSRAGPTGSTPSPTWSTCATRASRSRSSGSALRGATLRGVQQAGRRRDARRPRTTCSASRTAARRYNGVLAGLQGPDKIMSQEATPRKRALQAAARRASPRTPRSGTTIAAVEKKCAADVIKRYALERAVELQLAAVRLSPRTLVRLVAEKQQAERRAAARVSRVGADVARAAAVLPAPIYADFEERKLADSLELDCQGAGRDTIRS